ncbi:hypothetical protein VFPPC_04289 [Pochonia chlamydosporia 170]|uniref:Uncharacterized protein n=1 Tax=Pochonia chlamydosporia 170 TaxID=1380566 RepID=A0A179FQV3_METCM|nr:hypothetical protein VFPPC_04289 [Pochonia chlamydosporia 170]OAQ67972.1 hypothetical protein VFPPC_04289 [Pochonia chlamydosporia 170]
MLSSPSPVNGQSSPCRTPVQGEDGFSNSPESTPRSASSAGVTSVGKTRSGSNCSPNAASGGRQAWVEPASPTRQSPLRKSTVPGDDESSDDQESLASPSRSTLESLRRQRAKMSLTGDGRSRGVPEGSHSRPGAWSMRRNNRVVAESPAEVQTTSQESTPTKLRSSPATANASSTAANTARSKVTSPASASRFSFFNMASTLKGLASSPVSVPKDDELMNLDIDAALFPGGPPSDSEPFSPAAFKNLQMNATGLLRKFQAAYQDKAIACQELRAERDAQEDEKIEVQTRTAHLKMQLEGMAQKAAETEAMMQALMEELNREKRLRAEEKSARDNGVMSSGMSTISEDLGVEDDQRKKYRRRSSGTTKSDEAGFDTDDESIDEVSVFSRSRSPTLGASISDANSEIPSQSSATTPNPKPAMLEPPRPTRQSQPQMSAFQKLFKGISGESERMGVQTCQNCKGQDASVAWDTVGLLRDENRGLKQRVGVLESAVEDCLDAVMGVNL